MAELIDAVVSWPSLLLVLVVFGFAPGFCLRLIVLAYPRNDPRRAELIAELYAVPRIQRPLWVAEQLEVALFEGLAHRVSAALRRLTGRRRARARAGDRAERLKFVVMVGAVAGAWVGVGVGVVVGAGVGAGAWAWVVAMVWAMVGVVAGAGAGAGAVAGAVAGVVVWAVVMAVVVAVAVVGAGAGVMAVVGAVAVAVAVAGVGAVAVVWDWAG